MNRIGLFLLVLCAGAVVHAANDVSWVSSTGSDGNPCTNFQPCRTFTTAISNTVTGGEVHALGDGDFCQTNGMSINKAITIDGSGPGAVCTGPGGGAAGIVLVINVTGSSVTV